MMEFEITVLIVNLASVYVNFKLIKEIKKNFDGKKNFLKGVKYSMSKELDFVVTL